MKKSTYARTSGISYLIIFFAAIFANFFVLEAILSDPLRTIQESGILVRAGIIAFLITVVFDVVVAWALFELFPSHPLSRLSTYFRLMHACIMAVAVFALVTVFEYTTAEKVLMQAFLFNTIWLIGLFFFGFHLILLARIFKGSRFIAAFLLLAGIMYIIDTCAHFLLPNYDSYADVFLIFVALPSVIGEMSLAIWLIAKAGTFAST